MRYPNLIPNSERSPEELREMGRKGGIASGEARRRNRDMKKAVKLWMQIFDDLEKKGISPNEALAKLEKIMKK